MEKTHMKYNIMILLIVWYDYAIQIEIHLKVL